MTIQCKCFSPCDGITSDNFPEYLTYHFQNYFLNGENDTGENTDLFSERLKEVTQGKPVYMVMMFDNGSSLRLANTSHSSDVVEFKAFFNIIDDFTANRSFKFIKFGGCKRLNVNGQDSFLLEVYLKPKN
ncbi:hypothetical protein ACJJVG_08850 [Pseudocitrobacter faecalis]|uniref:hypothetical protein n=1 Tax=Pseudocitrobacter faecalis TaxID=1398493 RepID=UPI00389AE3C9